jgi:hypothetical protein
MPVSQDEITATTLKIYKASAILMNHLLTEEETSPRRS